MGYKFLMNIGADVELEFYSLGSLDFLNLEYFKHYGIYKDSQRFAGKERVRIELSFIEKLPKEFEEIRRGLNKPFSEGGGYKKEYFLQRGEDNLPNFGFVYDEGKGEGRLFMIKRKDLKRVAPEDYFLSFLKRFYETILYPIILLYHRAFFFHSAAISYDSDKAILLSGPSGAGKSTLVNRLKTLNYNIIANDKVIIKSEKGIFKVFIPPWEEKYSDTNIEKFELDKILFLKKDYGTNHRIEEMKGKEFFKEFYQNIVLRLLSKEKELIYADYCVKIVNRVKRYFLYHTLKDTRDPIRLILNDS